MGERLFGRPRCAMVVSYCGDLGVLGVLAGFDGGKKS